MIRVIEGYQVEIGEVKSVVSLRSVPEAKIGDYVLIGYAVSVVDEEA